MVSKVGILQKKAYFITIEGLEGSGKSSVISYIRQLLVRQGRSFTVFREPGSTLIGERIRDILLDKKNAALSPYTELLLYLAARTQLIEEKLRNDLRKHDVVIADRFFDSTLVYQGYALGLGKIAEEAVRIFSLGIVPDLTLLLDITPREGLRRLVQKDRIESRPLAFHRALRRGYLRLAKKYPRRIKVIDARTNLQELCARVEGALKKTLSL